MGVDRFLLPVEEGEAEAKAEVADISQEEAEEADAPKVLRGGRRGLRWAAVLVIAALGCAAALSFRRRAMALGEVGSGNDVAPRLDDAVDLASGVCPDTRPTKHYPLPSKTMRNGLPSGGAKLGSQMSPCDLHELQDYCVSKINEYRAGKPFSDGRTRNHGSKKPLRNPNTPYLQCMNQKALSDLKYAKSGAGCGHHTFHEDCGLGSGAGAENSCCPRRCTSKAECKRTLDGCLQQMWDEGQIVLDTGSTKWNLQTGHYWNMLTDADYVACGFGFLEDGSMLASQQFLSRRSQSELCKYNCATSGSSCGSCIRGTGPSPTPAPTPGPTPLPVTDSSKGYSKTKEGQQCQKPSQPVLDTTACRSAAQALGLPWGGDHWTLSHVPAGCCAWKGKAYFNNHAQGQAHSQVAQICSAAFAKGQKGTRCPASSQVTSKSDCEQAAKLLGMSFKYGGTWSHLQTGCMSQGTQAYFNLHKAGSSHKNIAPICYGAPELDF
uniref:Uncharacterized protein n=1 Tax=Pyrodinium bahamense TaxID=73915 RepID=A0A7S0AW55_9DINO